MKPKLYLYVHKASHFLRWERPELDKYFEVVQEPSADIPLLVFGPEAVEKAAELPASKRFAYIFPGFDVNPLHDLEFRKKMLAIFDERFELVFMNNGPLVKAYGKGPKFSIVPFSIDTKLVDFKRYRTRIDSLLHVSQAAYQKDWERSVAIMEATGLPFKLFPPRGVELHTRQEIWQRRLNRLFVRTGVKFRYDVPPKGYVKHSKVIELYHQYDGFVHIAGEKFHKRYIDGHILSTMLEAGLTGSILFWHDTHGMGPALETVFDMPLDIELAAARILELRESLDVEKHSRATREEILEKHNPEKSVRLRAEQMLERL